MKIDRAEVNRRASSLVASLCDGTLGLRLELCLKIDDAIEQAVRETAEYCADLETTPSHAAYEIRAAFGLHAPAVGGSPTPAGGGESNK